MREELEKVTRLLTYYEMDQPVSDRPDESYSDFDVVVIDNQSLELRQHLIDLGCRRAAKDNGGKRLNDVRKKNHQNREDMKIKTSTAIQKVFGYDFPMEPHKQVAMGNRRKQKKRLGG